MKLKNNQSGIAHLAAILAVVVVVAIGVVGWKVWDNSKNNKQSSTSKTNQTNTKPQASQKQKVSSPDYAIWEKQTVEDLSPNEQGRYKQKGGTGTLSVYSKEPMIFYSSNAPVYCQYDGGEWVHYSAINTNPLVYSKEEASDSCDSIKEEELSGQTAHTRNGGALGQSTFSAAIENDKIWFVFKDYHNYGTSDVSEAESQTIEDNLHKSIESLVTKTFATN